jgi:hypothetical protein
MCFEDLIIQFFPTSYYFMLLWSKYYPQQHFLKYFKSLIFP